MIKIVGDRGVVPAYPKLKIFSGMVVLFISPGRGLVIRVLPTDYTKVGDWSDTWNESVFTDYNEPVTIQNE